MTILIAATFLGAANALQCYNCMGQSADCEGGAMIQCPGASEFCKLEWTAATGYTAQTCAVTSDCPIGPALKKRQADGSGSTAAGGSAANDINNCCNYDGCNCIGKKHFSIGCL